MAAPNNRIRVDRCHTDREIAFGTVRTSQRSTTVTASLLTLAIIASGTMLYLASSLLVPIAIACIAYLTLRPIVCKLCQRGFSPTIASGFVILILFGILSLIVGLLYQPAQHWLESAPESIAKMRDNLDAWRKPLTALDTAGQRLASASASASGSASAQPNAVEVSVQKPSIVSESVLINSTGQLLAFFVAIAVLTFFLLSTGDDLINRILHVLPNDQKRHKTLEAIVSIQDSVGKYFAQITLINFGLGVVVAGVMWLVGMPTPVLWGVLAMLFNFIPYVGAIAAASLVFIAALSTFDSLARAAFTMLVFWLCTAMEGQFVTPTILGKTLKVGPVVVLVAVAVWGFLWGLPGVFVAVPLLMMQRHIFARFDSTRPLAVVLGEEPAKPISNDETLEKDEPIKQAVAS